MTDAHDSGKTWILVEWPNFNACRDQTVTLLLQRATVKEVELACELSLHCCSNFHAALQQDVLLETREKFQSQTNSWYTYIVHL